MIAEFDCPQMPPPEHHNYGKATWRDNNTCSHCGSVHPETFLQAVRDGAVLTPTDKNYKAYIDLPQHPHSKFYFDHMTDAQKSAFVDLLNARAVKFAAPGHFYVMPFFIGRG